VLTLKNVSKGSPAKKSAAEFCAEKIAPKRASQNFDQRGDHASALALEDTVAHGSVVPAV
jgi:hypothetical protein